MINRGDDDVELDDTDETEEADDDTDGLLFDTFVIFELFVLGVEDACGNDVIRC